MANEYLVVTGSFCLIAALAEAWLLVMVFSMPGGGLARLIPGIQDLLKSHIDHLMMALLLFVFFLLFGHFRIAAPAWAILALCLGSIGNPALFLVRAIRPALKEPTPAFRLAMSASCSLTTLGYVAGAWMVGRAAGSLL
jgi:hypothetical protein